MRIPSVCCLAAFLGLVSLGCVEKLAPVPAVPAPRTTLYQPRAVNPASLTADQQAVVMAMDLARQGLDFTSPLVVPAADAKIDLTAPGPGFTVRNESVVRAAVDPDGTRIVDVLRELADPLGRISLTLDRTVYVLRPPSRGEAQQVAMILQQDYDAAVASGNPELADAMRESVLTFQRSTGLSQDGVLGAGTAKAMVKDLELAAIQGMQSQALYPDSPRFEVHVLPERIVAQAADSGSDRFTRGFDSLEAVRAAAVPPDQLEITALREGNFVLFVYFLDRLPPLSSVEVGFSLQEGLKDARNKKATMKPVYTAPDSWPVIVAPFSLPDVGPRLYVNLFINEKPAGSVKLK